jgi:hypothetical protein
MNHLFRFFRFYFPRYRWIKFAIRPAHFKTLFWQTLGLGIMFYPHPVQAIEITPFYTQNQSPLVLIFGLPSIGEASLVPVGRLDARLLVDLANNFAKDFSPRGEAIFLDVETHRSALDFRYGIARKMEFGIQIPNVSINGGFLDSFVEAFHGALGLGQGHRTEDYNGQRAYGRYELKYYYIRDGKFLLNAHAAEGLGDIRLMGGWQLYQEPSRAVALRVSLKLPTADSNLLLGSGSTDLALWVTARNDFKMTKGHITIFGGAGIMGMSRGEVLPDQQRNLVWFGNVGAGWSPVSWFAFKMQIDGSTPFYKDSDLRELTHDTALLTFGLTFALSPQTTLDIGVSEDIEVSTAPDVNFHFALRHRF